MSRVRLSSYALPAVAALSALQSIPTVLAQQPEEWNAPRALELIRRGRELRQATAVDSSLRSYAAQARGYVYFYLDRTDSHEKTLVKADQIALDVFWRAPNETKQRIVGLRDEKLLPTSIRYHLDHLTVVLDDFDDFIRLGDGDEVGAVLHPLGPKATDTYDFRLTDSLSVSYGGGVDEVRVYEVQVRPKRFEQPAFLGSVYLDRTTAAIVRMRFTFTPASYVDPHLDYIRISLDNALWMGRHWLPYRQEAELRRELPQLDFLVGSVIRGRFEIGTYRFNPDLPDAVFVGRGVSALPKARREAFPFQRGLFADLEEEGLSSSTSLDQIRGQVIDALRSRYMSGLARSRLQLGSVSEAVRYNRAEGIFLGGGVSVWPAAHVRLGLGGGYSVGRRDPTWSVAASGGPGSIVPTLEVAWDRPRDLGPRRGASRVVNTLAAMIATEDFTDLYFVRGARLSFRGPSARPPSFAVGLRWERHQSARDVVSADPGAPSFRPVRPIEEGILGALDLTTSHVLPASGRVELAGTFGRFETRTYASLVTTASWVRRPTAEATTASLDASAGLASSRAPDQAMFLLGGRGTLPGHRYRGFIGSRYWLIRAEGTHPVRYPWVSLRTLVAAGQARLSGPPPEGWPVTGSGGVRGSLGLGLSLAWDVLRLDVVRGIRGGDWELTFSVDPQFHPWL